VQKGGIYLNYGDIIIFTSWEQGTSSLLHQVLIVDRQILIIEDFVMALPCQCSCIYSAALLSYFWTPFVIHHYYSNACASQRCTQIIMLPSVDNSSLAAHITVKRLAVGTKGLTMCLG
jgi:hypothetical protein